MNQLFYPFSGFSYERDALSTLLALQSCRERQFVSQIPSLESLYAPNMRLGYTPSILAASEPLKKQQPYYQKQELDTTESSQAGVEKPSKVEKPSDKKSYSKYCLRFCRKLSKVILEQIEVRRSLFNSLVEYCAEASNAVFVAYQLPKMDCVEYSTLVRNFLRDNWNKFKAQMSYSYNKGICIVKNEDWASVFDRNTLTRNFQAYALWTGKQAENKSIDYELLFSDEGLVNSLGRILHSCCIILFFTIIFKDGGLKAKYLRSLDKIDNFLTSVINPDLFKNYNHRSGKFAGECCGKCKRCRSKLLNPDFAKELEKARKIKDFIQSFVEFSLPKTSQFTNEQVASLYNLAVSSL